MNPFIWQGPYFFVPYTLLVVGGFLVAFSLRLLLRGPGGPANVSRLALGPYDVARLNSPDVAMQLAVVSLFHRGALRAEGGSLQPATLPPDTTPLERAVHTAMASSPPLSGLRWAVREQVKALGARLVERGLLVSPGRTVLLRALPSLLFAPVLAVGFVQVVLGLTHGSVQGDMVPLLVVAGLGLYVLLSKPDRTRLGDATLAALRKQHEPLFNAVSSSDAPSAEDLALAVGLFSVGPLPHEPGFAAVSRYLSPPIQRTQASTFDTDSIGR